ncbi:MAG: adenylate/guanylate cyclase domain-containing protein, partial [bacterium]
ILNMPPDERDYALAGIDPDVVKLMRSVTAREASEIRKELKSFKGKIVVVGRTAVGTEDLNPTPLEPRYPILGLHANMINTIIERAFIRRTPVVIVAALFFALAVSLGFVGGTVHHASSFVTGAINFSIMIATAAVFLAVCFALFIWRFIDLPLLTPMILIVLTFLLVFLYRFLTEEQEKKKMKGMFSTYVNREVVESLIEDPDKLKLGGEWMDCTVFFSDVAGFTTISESMPPEDLVELLNEYLTAMTDIIFQYGGTLDKYVGDAIVAVYGAPVPFDDHAVRACLATLDMQKKLAEMRAAWREQGKVELTARCGINTGAMIAGNMGSATRFNYTVMGRNVEFGEHLESGGKKWGSTISISETTREKAKDHVITRWLDVDLLEGKPVKIFELLARSSDGLPENVKKGVETYEEGLKLYFMKKWDEAIARFNEVFEHVPGDGPAKKALQRCEEARSNAPGAEFDVCAAHALGGGA